MTPLNAFSKSDNEKSSEKLVFDKAEKAGKLEQLRKLHEDLLQRAKDLEQEIDEVDETDQEKIESELARVKRRIGGLESVWDGAEEKLKD